MQPNPSNALEVRNSEFGIRNSDTPHSALAIPHSIQPIVDVPQYLLTRKPRESWEGEEALFITLPEMVRREVKALMRAFATVKAYVKGASARGMSVQLNMRMSIPNTRVVKGASARGMSVQAACKLVLKEITFHPWNWTLVRFRARFDAWVRAKDWIVLVNRAKAGALWQRLRTATNRTGQYRGLPPEFLEFCAARMGRFVRLDGKRQAWLSICRQWQTGRNLAGDREPIPGFGCLRTANESALRTSHSAFDDLPMGWSYSNVMRQLKRHAKFTRATQALLHQGTAAAREFLPQVRGTRAQLRFMEEVQFDDVKTDWRTFDPESGQVQDLWLLVARDRATALLLGFGMRPARVREDGSQEHLKLRDMKQLCGWLLERYGLPPYEMIWKLERGTATLSEGSAAALQEMLPGRIRISFSSMLGKNSAAGYFERRIGNSKGKASLESHNRLMHTMGAHLPGQTGPEYGQRPTDLPAREKEAIAIWSLAQHLPPQLRSEARYPLLTIGQSRTELFRIFALQNRRTEHDLEGFETILEFRLPNAPSLQPSSFCAWQPQSTAPDVFPEGAEFRRRKESPLERAARLIEGLEWTRVSPDVVRAFYEHTQRQRPVENNGEIKFQFEGNDYFFRSPEGSPLIAPGTRVLCYFNPDDPAFLYVTSGKGAILGVWHRSGRAATPADVSLAIAYAGHALKVTREYAGVLAHGQRAELADMREHNAALLQGGDFIEVENPSSSGSSSSSVPVGSGVAAALVSRPTRKQREQTAAGQLAEAQALL